MIALIVLLLMLILFAVCIPEKERSAAVIGLVLTGAAIVLVIEVGPLLLAGGYWVWTHGVKTVVMGIGAVLMTLYVVAGIVAVLFTRWYCPTCCKRVSQLKRACKVCHKETIMGSDWCSPCHRTGNSDNATYYHAAQCIDCSTELTTVWVWQRSLVLGGNAK